MINLYQFRNVNQRLAEINRLEKRARRLYKQQPANERGNFRTFFAQKILNISETNLQRMLSLRNLTEKGKIYIQKGKINFTFGAELSSLPPNMQDKYLAEIENHTRSGTVTELLKFKKNLKQIANNWYLPAKNNEEKDNIVEINIDGLPKSIRFNNFQPQQEAALWITTLELKNLEKIRDYTKAQIVANELDEMAAAQWNMRLSEVMFRIVMLKRKLDDI